MELKVNEWSRRSKRILSLALPIVAGMMSQNLLNLVDTAMVGGLGDASLAAVGLGAFVTFMSQSLLLGISPSVQAIAARRKGEGHWNRMAYPLNGGILLVGVIGLPLTISLYFISPSLYPFLNQDPAVLREGIPYLQIRLLAIPLTGLNFAFRGYWNAVDLSRLYLSTILIIHASNILLNYLLIYGNWGFPELGTLGSGVGSAIATGIGTLAYFYLGSRYAKTSGFMRGLPGASVLKSLIRLSLPNGVQQLLFSGGFTALYWIVGRVGTPELAAANVLINIALVAILPCMGLGLGASTLVGQALGRSDVDDASSWAWNVSWLALGLMILLAIPLWIAPSGILEVFISDPETVRIALFPLQVLGVALVFEAFATPLMHAHLGAGDARRVLWVTLIFQWSLFLPVAYWVGPVAGYGLSGVWLAFGAYRGLVGLALAMLWHRRAWAHVRL